MAKKPQYKRVLIKLSGESFCSDGAGGIDAKAIEAVIAQLMPALDMGVQIAVVVGGGNIIRGRDLESYPRLKRTTADFMGMLGTVVNALALRDGLQSHGLPAVAMSAIPMPTVCENFSPRQAVENLEQGKVVVFAAGTGCPFFSTDMCAALRASEIDAEALMKATKVDGVFDSDPMKNKDAKKYDQLKYEKVLADRLGVMDLAAVTMCMESRISVIVFEFFKPDNLINALSGEKVGTIVTD